MPRFGELHGLMHPTPEAIIAMKDYEYNYPAYINIPFFVLKDKKLDAFNKQLFAFFWSFSVAGRKIVTSNGYLSGFLDVTERHIQNCLKYLEDIGYIQRVMNGNHRRIEVLCTVNTPIDFEDSHDPDPQKKLKIVEKHDDLEGRTTVRPPHEPQFAPPRTTVHPYIKAYNKEDIKEKDTPKPSAPAKAESDKTFLLTLEDMIKDNPYGIAAQMLAEWLIIRKRKKAPLTHCAWNRTNKVLTRLVNDGLDAIDCFERMVANGWQGMEYKYFEQELKSTPITRKSDIDKEIRARELKVQEEKRREFEAPKNVINSIIQRTGFSEANQRYLEERERLGMDARKLHEYNMKKHLEKIQAGG
jgi:hypothetical protein